MAITAEENLRFQQAIITIDGDCWRLPIDCTWWDVPTSWFTWWRHDGVGGHDGAPTLFVLVRRSDWL